MLALSIRPTRIVGERFHIYAAKKRASVAGRDISSRDLAMPGGDGDALPRRRTVKIYSSAVRCALMLQAAWALRAE